MIVLNNNYEIKKVLDNVTNNMWTYEWSEEIDLLDKNGEHKFLASKFSNEEGTELIIYVTPEWGSSSHISVVNWDDKKYDTFEIVTDKLKDEMRHRVFEFVDMYSEEVMSDPRSSFKCDLEIGINTYSEDIIEANFLEDNKREMTDADWDLYRELETKVILYIVNRINDIIGWYRESTREGDMEIFSWGGFRTMTDKDTLDKLEALLSGHVLDDDTRDTIYNRIIINEVDWSGNAGIDEKEPIYDIVESIVIQTPKGHPLYYILGGR